MDFGQFEVEIEKPVFVQFTHPITGSPLYDDMEDPNNPGKKTEDTSRPVGVMLYGQDSQKFLERQRQLRDKKLFEAQKSRNPKTVKIEPEEIEQSNRDTVKACIDSFINVVWEGEDLGARRDQYDAFFKKHPWAYEFCNKAVMDRSYFLKASQKNY